MLNGVKHFRQLLFSYMSYSKCFFSKGLQITVISTGGPCSSKSLFIVGNRQRYLINCGEGTQKLLFEECHMKNLKNIFFTRSSQQNLCGLIGMVHVFNSEDCELSLHGTEKSIDIVNASKKYINNFLCKIDINLNSYFEDSTFIVDSFRYQNKTINDGDKCVGYLFTQKLTKDDNVLKHTRIIRNEWLQREIQNGAIIKSEHLLNSSRLKSKFLVLECPTAGHIKSMEEALPLHSFNNNDSCLRLIFHLTDKRIFQLDSYQEVIQYINSQCSGNVPPTHVIIDSTVSFPLSYSTYYLQTCLNYFFDHQLFPKLKFYEDYISGLNKYNVYEKSVSTKLAEPLMQFGINSTNVCAINQSNEAWVKLKNLNEKNIINEVLNKNIYFPPEHMIKYMANLKQVLTAKKDLVKYDNSSIYPNITFLGTGSQSPSKYRNTTSILIAANCLDFVMFDCGEGTIHRIIMRYGLDQGNEIIRNIILICISHDHLDHHLGLYMLLRYRELIGNCKPCLVLAARSIRYLTKDFDTIFKTKHTFYNCSWCPIDLLELPNNKYSKNFSWRSIEVFEEEFGLRIKPVRVFHTSSSYGFVLSKNRTNFEKSWKITYSGDCCPKFDDLIREGLNSDILIHEATMDDNLESMAAIKLHSTTSQAISEGVKMRAKFTILTHFSNRYVMLPPLCKNYGNVAQAMDFLTIDLKTCKYLNVLSSYLEYLFPKYYNILDSRNQKLLQMKEINL